MRLCAQELGRDVILKAVHHGKDYDQRHDADGYAYHGQTGSKADEALALLGPEIFLGNDELESQDDSPFRSRGKRMTSLMEGLSVKSITSRSMPMPSPAAGAMPYSSALI